MHTMDDIVSQMNCSLTAEQYVNEDEDIPTHLSSNRKDDAKWCHNLRSAVVEGCLEKCQELEGENESSDDEEEKRRSLQILSH